MAKESKNKLGKPSPGDQEMPNSMELLEQYSAGNSTAANELFDRYITRLIALAKSRLGKGIQRRVDPEDIVQSAYRSFFVRARNGDFQLQQSGDLWRLLSTITLNKLRRQAERHTASRRDYRRDEMEAPYIAQTTSEPTPEQAAVLIEQVQLVFERLSGTERLALAGFLAGDSIEDTASRSSKSARTVRRALQKARHLAEQVILDAKKHQDESTPEIPPLENPLPYSDFRLERLIGAGGMGKVYRATQLSTEESVAVKALRKDKQADARAVRQFLHEASVVAGLRHSAIIQVRGLGRFPSGGYFIVMDWVDGVDLQTLIDRGELSKIDCLQSIKNVAEAVAYSHAAGVVHCDLKPSNILIGTQDQVVVTDFGFAQLLSDDHPPMAVGGTLGYLAPEVLLTGARPTPAADIFSIGKLMENLGLGRSNQFVELIGKCTSRQFHQRPQSAQEFLTELNKLLSK